MWRTATRASVLKQVQQTGYESNRSARGLVSGSNGLIGVTVPEIQAEYFGQLLAGVAEALDEHDLRVVLCPTQNEHEREVSLLSRLMHGTSDGAILIHPDGIERGIAAYAAAGVSPGGHRSAAVDRSSFPGRRVGTLVRRESRNRAFAGTRTHAHRSDYRAGAVECEQGTSRRLSVGLTGGRNGAGSCVGTGSGLYGRGRTTGGRIAARPARSVPPRFLP